MNLFLFLLPWVSRPLKFRTEVFYPYIAKWNALSRKEKVITLYALNGFLYRNEFENYVPDDTSTRDFGLDIHMEKLKTIEDSCKNYYEMNPNQLTKCFRQEIDNHWQAMRLSGDYDIDGTTEELEYIFREKDNLLKFVRRYKSDEEAIEKFFKDN